MTHDLTTPLTAAKYYQKDFLPIYEEVCGDRETYSQIEKDFEYILARTYYSYPEYAAIKDHTAAPQDASRFFRSFLAGGSKCPDASTIGRANQASHHFTFAASNTTILEIDDRFHHIPHPQRLYSSWQQFLQVYLEAVAKLKEAIGVLLKTENMDFIALREISKAAGVSENVAKIMAASMQKTNKAELNLSLEGTAIFYQNQRLNNFRQVILHIARATDPEPQDQELLSTFLQIFLRAYDNLQDPFDWVSKVTLEFLRDAGPQVTINTPPNPPRLRPENPLLLWQLLDQVAMTAIHESRAARDFELKFSWDGFRKQFVITMPRIDYHPSSDLDRLIKETGAQRSTTHPQSKKGHLTQIRIPMRAIAPAPRPDGSNTSGSSAPPSDSPTNQTHGTPQTGALPFSTSSLAPLPLLIGAVQYNLPPVPTGTCLSLAAYL